MVVTTIRVREDGSLVLPREASQRLGLAPDSEVVVEQAEGRSPLEGNYLILHKYRPSEELAAIYQRQVDRLRVSLKSMHQALEHPEKLILPWMDFREELESLWRLTRGAEDTYRRTVTLLQLAARKVRLGTINEVQLEALLTVLDRLWAGSPRQEDIAVCDSLLREAGLDIMIEFPPDLLRTYHELL